jgi:hypothetical protein
MQCHHERQHKVSILADSGLFWTEDSLVSRGLKTHKKTKNEDTHETIITHNTFWKTILEIQKSRFEVSFKMLQFSL